ncbi:cytochrome b5 reductase 4-like [Lycorma delicatula]|uniref:cytochrome b5 reductase 4-like n=1 Tax=Lycorma delicatula TaxID=130591 RepID=UPI003F50EE63
MASGSATGNPRNKVALKPGHSLMDWIRLGNSGKDLTGVGGAFTNVTKAELAEHKSMEDAWLCIRGVVYNVTHYMDFHPGGCDELMRGVGTDATNLFNQVHAWVNYESILKKCVVGRLGSSGEDDAFTIPSSPNKPASSSLRITAVNNKAKLTQMDWFQQLAFITLVFYSKTPNPQVQILLSEPDVLQCKINQEVQILQLEGKVRWPCYASMNLNGKVQIKLIKKKPALWKDYGQIVNKNSEYNSCTSSSSSTNSSFLTDLDDSNYWPTEVIKIAKVTHDTCLIKLKYNNNNVYNYIPPGNHIFVKQSVKGDEVIRPYTPVPIFPVTTLPPGDWKNTDEGVNLLVKTYPLGHMSSWLCSRRPGSTVFISNPKGTFRTSVLNNATEIYLFAAGSGLTPMLSVLVWVLQSTSDKVVKLLFFNKTKKDIIWERELEDLASENSRFTVEHILSEPNPEWTGKRGHVTLDLIQTFLPCYTVDIPRTNFICICGPRPFTLLIEKWLKEDLGYTGDNYYSFLGQ